MVTPSMNVPQPGPRWGYGLIVGLVAGLVLGGGAVGLVWALSSGSSTGTEADVAAVCGIVERSPELETEDDFSVPNLNRWGAAAFLAMSIKADKQYEALADALEKVQNSIQTFDLAEVKRSSAKVRAECANLT